MFSKFRWVFVAFVALFVLGIFWNIFMFADCMSSGKRAYQCNAAINHPNYIGYDDYNN